MKRTDFIPVLLISLLVLLGGGWMTARRLREKPHSWRKILEGSWLMVFLLVLAGISLVVFLTYAFAFANSATIAVI